MKSRDITAFETEDDVRRKFDEKKRAHDGAPHDGDGLLAPTMVPEYLDGRAPDRQREGLTATEPRYYDYPPLKKPHWKFHVPLYFWVGGIAGGAELVASIAHLFGGRRDAGVVRAGRYLAAPLIAIAQLLLILDLGRPERGPFMFRIVKTRSPMSVGSWGLGAFSAISGSLFVLQAVTDVFRAGWARVTLVPLALLAIPSSLFVGGYTGVLLSATSVPLWAKARRFLAAMFVSSAISTGASAIAIVLALLGRAPRSPALAGTIAAAAGAEIAMDLAMEAELGKSKRHLSEPPEGARHGAALVLGAALPIALLAPSLRSGRGASAGRLLIAGALVLAGGLLTRFSIVDAGKRSADDAASYWDLTRP